MTSAPIVPAQHVWLAGKALPERWQGRERFVVLETGFGAGNNFLAAWNAWRHDPRACGHLHFISIEARPPTGAELRQAHRDSPLPALARALVDAWPPLTPGLHRLSFEGGRVQLLLAVGDVAKCLAGLTASVDAFCLDDLASARDAAVAQPPSTKALARLAAPGSTDFALHAGAQVLSRRRSDARRAAAVGANPSRHALIVGAGLAGCAAAWALAEQGWQSTLIERHEQPTQESSGNPAGLFHGIVNRHDGAHARFNRAAALEAARAVRHAVDVHGAPGSVAGLLRLDPGVALDTLRQTLADTGLPGDYVQAVSAEQASALAGLALPHPGWFFPGGGWVAPGALAASLRSRAGSASRFRGGLEVASIRHAAAGWELLDARGALIETAPTLVLANAFEALRLLGAGFDGAIAPAWPVRKVRGQISLWQMPGDASMPSPRIPLAGAGYLLPRVGSQLVFGATAQPGDDDTSVRHADHVHNLVQLAHLSGGAFGRIEPETLQGRTGWRMVSNDRLPIIGAVPDPSGLVAPGARPTDSPRFVPRLPGLFVFTALGSRGITWAPLGAQVLASSITGAPQPLEAALLDAIDPARFVVRAARRAARDA
jgi:tRNA 5-methylaminomethyl-2-thiouridine biosynthesis bifunctional protein